MKSLQADNNTVAVEIMHVVLGVCQQLRISAEQNTDNLNRMQCECDALSGRIQEMTNTMQQDKEIIAEQREQIGAFGSFFFVVSAKQYNQNTFIQFYVKNVLLHFF